MLKRTQILLNVLFRRLNRNFNINSSKLKSGLTDNGGSANKKFKENEKSKDQPNDTTKDKITNNKEDKIDIDDSNNFKDTVENIIENSNIKKEKQDEEIRTKKSDTLGKSINKTKDFPHGNPKI